ncbi:hypothetical protein EYF80_021567 [Liparis tanakae]|uniref:Uncharacterized protein n=1 Tax=Liparis tanakae TaxID=230148 RepID=A0A4Z2HSI5_9TELE|nr:hypothetical protein EYF80_021567 [Liparis tanakae]
MSVSTDELLSEGHVRGNIRQFLQRVAAHTRVRALDAFVQVLCTAALCAAATTKELQSELSSTKCPPLSTERLQQNLQDQERSGRPARASSVQLEEAPEPDLQQASEEVYFFTRLYVELSAEASSHAHQITSASLHRTLTVLKDVIWRRDGQNNRRGTGRVLIDQQDLDGTRRTLETDLVFPLTVEDLNRNPLIQSETRHENRPKELRKGAKGTHDLQVQVWGPLAVCQWEHGLPGECHLRKKDRSSTPSFASWSKVTNLVVSSPRLFSCLLGVCGCSESPTAPSSPLLLADSSSIIITRGPAPPQPYFPPSQPGGKARSRRRSRTNRRPGKCVSGNGRSVSSSDPVRSTIISLNRAVRAEDVDSTGERAFGGESRWPREV